MDEIQARTMRKRKRLKWLVYALGIIGFASQLLLYYWSYVGR
jgi:hypothetical protein